MKELSHISEKIGVSGREEILFEVVKHLAFALFGFLSARGSIMGGIMPFCPAIIGGAYKSLSVSCAAGTVAGYIVTAGNNFSFRYVVIAVSIAAIKILAQSAVKGGLRPAFCALITALTTVATDIVVVKNDFMDIVLAVVETVIAAAGAYFISRTSYALRRLPVGFTAEELSALLISSAVVLSGFYFFTVGSFSVGRVLAGVIIMLTARFASSSVSAVCGVAYGVTALACTNDFTAFAVSCLCGLISGAFAKLGKYGIAFSYAVAAFTGCALIDVQNSVVYIIEALFSCAIFLVVPKNTSLKFGKIISPRAITEAPAGLKKSVTMRLSFAATALCDVAETIEQVAGELSKVNTPKFAGVFVSVERQACKGCNLRMHCWEARREETTAAIAKMTRAIKSGEKVFENEAEDDFLNRCVRPAAVKEATSRSFSEYAAAMSAEMRIDEIRGVVSDQFSGISSMLYDLCDEIEKGEKYDNAAAENIVAGLKSIDIIADACCCRIDKYSRMSVEIRLPAKSMAVVNRMQIMRQVSLVCDRDFDAPVVTALNTETLVNLNERALLKADIGVEQVVKSGKTMCGDAYRYFLDGKGRAIMVISDGMGTGGRAAVDSAMASGLMSRLIRAGFGYDCSLKILNSSMIFKSTDESLATVDITVIDLFTGRTDLFKAGAAPTLVRRSGRTGKAQSSSLAAGILRDIAFDKATVRLKNGDILLMMSDGVIAEGTDWICAELENWQNGSAQELAEHIAHSAARRGDNSADDITVLAAIIEKAS
ncbi:MAG: SpoIIE family protein phosphatase [Clostridiales bacterium]|nr:SpoIIE family protein phosphatase [Candidatus Equinaster intestinalis]